MGGAGETEIMHVIPSRFQNLTQNPFSTGWEFNTTWLNGCTDGWIHGRKKKKERRQRRKVEGGDMQKGKSLGIATVRLGDFPIIPHLRFLPCLVIPVNCGPSSAKQTYGARP